MQGTNAHAVLSAHLDGSRSGASSVATAWQRKRMWFCPASLVLLQRCSDLAGGGVQLQTQISRAALAFYHDHRVSYFLISVLCTPGNKSAVLQSQCLV